MVKILCVSTALINYKKFQLWHLADHWIWSANLTGIHMTYSLHMIHTAVLIRVIFLFFLGGWGLRLNVGNSAVLALISNQFNAPFQFFNPFQDNLKFLSGDGVDLSIFHFADKNSIRGDLFPA
jgi:hypothetical protein